MVSKTKVINDNDRIIVDYCFFFRMITAELFSQGPRPAAMSVAVLVNWSANFFVAIGFPTMLTILENYTFLPFSMFLALFWVFTYRKVPETKNKTFDEIATLFRIGHKQR